MLELEQRDRNGNVGDPQLLLSYLLDGPIGQGEHRTVYVLKNFGSRLVAKVAHQYEMIGCLEGIRMNISEYNFWYNTRHMPKITRWLCPVKSISHDGRMIIMDEAVPLNDEEWSYVRDNAPDWLRADFKRENFGRLVSKDKDRDETAIVCVDYGIISFRDLISVSYL